MANPYERPPGRREGEQEMMTCPKCGGSGRCEGASCDRCGGRGRIPNRS